MNPFNRSPGDLLLKFKIGDLFPKNDPLARDIVRMMAADTDLLIIKNLENLLELSDSDSQADTITRKKRESAGLFQLRLRLGFLSNALDEIVFKKYKKNDRSPLKALLQEMPGEGKNAYDQLEEAVKQGGRSNEIIGKFRNFASFHYSDHEFMQGMERLENNSGEIITNEKDGVTRDMHFVLGYQVLDAIPACDISRTEVLEIREETDHIQGLFQALTVTLVDQYLLTNELATRISRENG